MADCVRELERHGRLVRIREELDPDLEIAEVHRRVFDAQGPALLFERVKGSPFPAVSNLYGTFERTEFLFRRTLHRVRRVIELKVDPTNFLRRPFRYLSAPFTALSALPRRQWFGLPVQYGETTIDQLPQIKSWPMDGGAFITLPQVCTLPPGSTQIMQSNLGMYRIQLSGNDYEAGREIGLHYQLHRGIGVHHTLYNASDEPFRASIFVGGPPAHAFAAIMPLPEGLSELTFAGMLAGRRFRYGWDRAFLLSADADFVITGTIRKGEKKMEGPFGDHLGYYSLAHEFPVMEVDKVYHRKDAIWHFTVVGRPPQEDSSFGYLIHQLVAVSGARGAGGPNQSRRSRVRQQMRQRRADTAAGGNPHHPLKQFVDVTHTRRGNALHPNVRRHIVDELAGPIPGAANRQAKTILARRGHVGKGVPFGERAARNGR